MLRGNVNRGPDKAALEVSEFKNREAGDITLNAFVLTIETSKGPRRQHAERELEKMQLKSEFMNGFDKNDPSILDIYSAGLNLLYHKRPLTMSEVATYAGHRLIWQRIVDCGADHALVLEDDFHVPDTNRFLKAISDCLSFRERWDIVKFFDFKPKSVIQEDKFFGTRVVAYKYPASGAVAYIINRYAAEKLLKRRKIYRPIDEDLSNMWEFSIRIWSTSPNLVEEVSEELGGSLLEADRLSRKTKRNIGRSLWGNFLQGWKMLRARLYRRRMWVCRDS